MTLRNQVLVWIGFTVVVILLIWLFRPILLPFVIGIAPAYILHPGVVLLERTGSTCAEGRYRFYSLDYFTSEEQALQHSSRWARNWVDTRG